MSTFSTNTIFDHCDTAISVVQEELLAVKTILAKYEMERRSLAKEKLSLETIVSSLRLERDQLKEGIANMKVTLCDLGREVVDTKKNMRPKISGLIVSAKNVRASTDNNGTASSDGDVSCGGTMGDDDHDNDMKDADISRDEGNGFTATGELSDDPIVEDSQDLFDDSHFDSTTAAAGSSQKDEVRDDISHDSRTANNTNVKAIDGMLPSPQKEDDIFDDISEDEDDDDSTVGNAEMMSREHDTFDEESTIEACYQTTQKVSETHEIDDDKEVAEEERSVIFTSQLLVHSQHQKPAQQDSNRASLLVENSTLPVSPVRMLPNVVSPAVSTAIRRRRRRKVYYSPKKWRRLIQTKRLQSFFIYDY